MTDRHVRGLLAIMLASALVPAVGGTALGADGDSATVFDVLAVVAAGYAA